MSRVRLTPAQVSAIECRTYGDEQVDGLVVRGRTLVFDDAAETFRALTDASNAEDDAAHHGHVTGREAVYARRAARSLAAVAGRVLAAGASD